MMSKRPTREELDADVAGLRAALRRLNNWSLWWPRAGHDWPEKKGPERRE